MASIRRNPPSSAAPKVPTLGSQQPWLPENESAWGKLTVAPVPADPATLITRQVKTEPGDYRGFYANVRDAILGAAPLAVTSEDGYRTIRLLELARESSAAARTLPVKF
jgi:scyllo-inositol 2-dehydrogenase (NADP+)